MSSVPYIFANQTGNIPLSQLDANFSNVKASVDYATTAGSTGNSNTAITVTASAQPNITSVGSTLSVSGNITTGNVLFGNGQVSGTGNITGGNLIVSAGFVSAQTSNISGATTTGVYAANVGATNTVLANTVIGFTANVNAYTQVTLQNKNSGTDATSDYIITADNGSDSVNYLDVGVINSGYDNNTPTNSLGNIVFAADSYIYAQGNVSANSQSGGNLAIGTTVPTKTIKIFAGGNTNNALIANISSSGIAVTGVVSASGNVTGGNIITAGKLQYTGLEIISPNYISVTGNAATSNLSTTVSTNILIANNTGYTHTINMPTSPVDGQLTTFAVSGNTMTLVLGTGTVTPTFAGSTTAGTAYTYVYRNSNAIWYRTN